MFAVNIENTDLQFGLLRVENWENRAFLILTKVVKLDKNVIYKYGLVKL